MEKLVNGTENYVEKEAKRYVLHYLPYYSNSRLIRLTRLQIHRLSSILQKKSLVPKKLDEIKIKANILAAFVEKKAAEAVGAATEHEKAEL